MQAESCAVSPELDVAAGLGFAAGLDHKEGLEFVLSHLLLAGIAVRVSHWRDLNGISHTHQFVAKAKN